MKRDWKRRFFRMRFIRRWFVKGGRGGWEAKCCKTRVVERSKEVMEGPKPSAIWHKWKVDQFTVCQHINLTYLTHLQSDTLFFHHHHIWLSLYQSPIWQLSENLSSLQFKNILTLLLQYLPSEMGINKSLRPSAHKLVCLKCFWNSSLMHVV